MCRQYRIDPEYKSIKESVTVSFESLSERYEFRIENFPEEWIPLVYLYDPDLPLFPIQYFHELDPDLPNGQRPGERDRVFGFIHKINYSGTDLFVSVATNKDLDSQANARYVPVVQEAVQERLGFRNSVTRVDIENSFSDKLVQANNLLRELWYQVADSSFGRSLPFGKMFDPVFGLERYIASWNSDGGRKGEYIQTHDFASGFGIKIQTGGGIHVDFYLLPTFKEFTDTSNPLNLFPKFSTLMSAAADFVSTYCRQVNVGTKRFSAFTRFRAGKFNTDAVLELINRAPEHQKDALLRNYTAFNRGPQRSIISLMMHHDLRNGYWRPDQLSTSESAALYEGLSGSYQSPKVVSLYAQLCFGNEAALPIDLWINTFLDYPFEFRPSRGNRHTEIFSSCSKWGKVERLIWLAAQSRKVHFSVCSEILWCIRYGGPDKQMRGANPLSCKICSEHIRNVCPAYASIIDEQVGFNIAPPLSADVSFSIFTSSGNNRTTNQTIERCEGEGVHDEYSRRDRPDSFRQFPISGHDGSPMVVADFIRQY